MEEIWMPVVTWTNCKNDYTGKYEINNFGDVKSLNYHQTGKEQILKPEKNKSGYFLIGLYRNNKQNRRQIHRLVWESFNGQIPEGMQVNHINEDKTDNRLENLNLMTPKENVNWGKHNDRLSQSLLNRQDLSKPIVQLTKNNEIVCIFKSLNEAGRDTMISKGNISCACRKLYRHKTAGGYKWEYAENIHPFVLRLMKDVYWLS